MARPKKRSKTKKILFAVEIIVLLVFIGGLYVYGQLMSRMDKTNTQKLDTQKVQVNEEVQDAINSEDSYIFCVFFIRVGLLLYTMLYIPFNIIL